MQASIDAGSGPMRAPNAGERAIDLAADRARLDPHPPPAVQRLDRAPAVPDVDEQPVA